MYYFQKDTILIIGAILVTLFAPLFLAKILFPLGKLFLPEGNIILTPSVRILCTLFMAIIDYILAYALIFHTKKRTKLFFNTIFFLFTILWNVFISIIWYLTL